MTREAYSHEVSSAGFWPGGAGGEGGPFFYSYAYPSPAGFADAAVAPGAARFDSALGEFLLDYEAVRAAPDPDAALLAFLESTYAAAADLGGWDRAALECALGDGPACRASGAGMSVAFRRESDEEHKEPRFELPIPVGPNLVTAAGLAQAEARVAALEAEVAAETDEARRAEAQRTCATGARGSPPPSSRRRRPKAKPPSAAESPSASMARPAASTSSATTRPIRRQAGSPSPPRWPAP